MLRFWRREDSPEAWLLRVTSSTKACKPTFWCMVTIFALWDDAAGAKACAEFVAKCIRIEQICNFGPGVVTVGQSASSVEH